MASYNPNIPVHGNPFLDIPSDMDSNPFRWVLEDIHSVFTLVRLIPHIIIPIGQWSSGSLDELYPDWKNLRDIFLHIVLIASQLLLIVSAPVAAVFLFMFPAFVHIIFYAAFVIITLIVMRLLNGAPTRRSLIGVPRTRPPVNDERELWFFINGIATGQHWHLSNLAELAEIFGREIVGIHNPTKGIILDLVECLIQRDLDYKTIDIRQGRAQLREALAAPSTDKVVLIVHSQGGIEASAIIDWLFCELPHDTMRKLEIYTFGNAARQFRNPLILERPDDTVPGRINPRRQMHGGRVIKYIEHYANSEDFVANIGVLEFTSSVAAYSNGSLFSGSVFTREGSGHLLNMHYLDPMFGPANSFMEMMVEVPVAGGRVERKAVRELSRLYHYRDGGSPEEEAGEWADGDGDGDGD